MTEISLSGRGARGESQADILRRTGQFGVLPTDTDAQAMAKLNADAAAQADAAAAIVPTLAADLDGVPWLHSDALTLTGLSTTLSWTSPALTIARAIKFASISGSGIGASEDYYISEVNVADGLKGDQIVVRRTSDNTVVANSLSGAIFAKNTTGATLVTFFGHVYKIRVTLLIDYRDFGASTGTIYSSANKLLVFKRGDGHVARATLLGRARNQAYDPGLVGGASGATWSVSGGSPTSSTAGAALAALGITNTIAIGTGTTVTGGSPYYYKVEYPDGRCNNKFGIGSVFVSSADSAQWPGTFQVVAYSAATGGSSVTLTAQPYFFEEITSTLRRYWVMWKCPDSTIGRFAIGFNSINTVAVMEAGGFTYALSDSELTPNNIALYDWNAYDLRDDKRALNLANVAGIIDGTITVQKFNYGNLIINPHLDPAGQAKRVTTGSITFATPSALLQAKGVKQMAKVGTGGTQFFIREDMLDENSSSKSLFVSCYVYSATGTNWATPRFYTYKGNTLTDTITMSTFDLIDTNHRWYYATITLGASTDYTSVVFGVSSLGTGADIHIGGCQAVVSGDVALTKNNTARDDWMNMKSVVEAAGFGRFWNKKWVQLGDSIMESYDVPEMLARRLGVNLINGGFGGCLMSKISGATGQNVYRNDMSLVAVADAVSSGSWTTMEASAAAMASGYSDDNTAIVARLKALDWTTVDYIGIAYGTNDQANSIPLGATTSTTTTEFNGAINHSVPLLQAAYPNAQIGFYTPVWRGPAHSQGDSNVSANLNGAYMSDFQDTIAVRCRYHALPALKLHEVLGVNLSNKAQYLNSADDLHPTRPRGANRWAKAMASLAGAVW